MEDKIYEALLDNKVKLNLGCGDTSIPGFINIDSNPNSAGANIFMDLDEVCNFFEKNSIDLIYASHVFEYYDWKKGLDFLKKLFKLLKPNGIIRLAVPNFRVLVELYISGTLKLNRIIGPLYGRWKITKGYIYHKTTYDYETLYNQLEEAGFINIQWWDWRKTEHKEVDDYSQSYIPHMDKENGILISLNLQGTKPGEN